VNERVQDGKCSSASEAVREALSLPGERDSLREQRLSALKRRIAAGMEASYCGDVIDGEEFLDQLLRENGEDAVARLRTR
jgi:Arc/MetJ-type ribon-helix-helix transcriptional regulator